MQRDLNAILGHIAQLNELDTTDIPAMAQVGGILGGVVHDSGEGLRFDEVRPSVDRSAVMAGAPEADGRVFKVPKGIGGLRTVRTWKRVEKMELEGAM